MQRARIVEQNWEDCRGVLLDQVKGKDTVARIEIEVAFEPALSERRQGKMAIKGDRGKENVPPTTGTRFSRGLSRSAIPELR